MGHDTRAWQMVNTRTSTPCHGCRVATRTRRVWEASDHRLCLNAMT